MYESPIQKLVSEIETNIMQQEENAVLEAIFSAGVHVDKEELIKALQYDRNQYEKGYKDGCRDSRMHGKPVPHYTTLLNSDEEPVETYRCGYECSNCGDTGIKRYCPNCGAKMDEGMRNE